MNWIKITPETELPEGDVIACYKTSKSSEIGILERIGDAVKVITKNGDVYWPITHFAIITNPEE